MSQCNYFYGSQAGAPALGTLGTGDINRVLDAVLRDGYNTINSGITLTFAGSPTRALVAKTGHGFRDQQIVRSAGWNQAEYNGDFRIDVIDADNFAFDVPGSPVTPATGSGSFKVAPLDWTVEYTGTNQRVWRAPEGNRLYLMVNDNSNTNTGIVRGFRTMSAITTGVGPFPTNTQASTNLKWPRPDPTSYTDVDWFVIGDRKRFFLGVNCYSPGCRVWCGFGDFKSYKAADAYNTFIMGAANAAGDDTISPVNSPPSSVQNSSQGSATYYSYGLALARAQNQSTDSLIPGVFNGLAPGAWPTSGAYSSASAGDLSPISGGIELGFVDFTEYVTSKYWRRGRAPWLSSWSPVDFANNDKAIYKGIAGMPFDKVIIARGGPQDASNGMIFPLGDWDVAFG